MNTVRRTLLLALMSLFAVACNQRPAQVLAGNWQAESGRPQFELRILSASTCEMRLSVGYEIHAMKCTYTFTDAELRLQTEKESIEFKYQPSSDTLIHQGAPTIRFKRVAPRK